MNIYLTPAISRQNSVLSKYSLRNRRAQGYREVYFSSFAPVSKVNLEKLNLLISSGFFKTRELSNIMEMKGRRIKRVLKGEDVLTNAEIIRLTAKTKITLDWLQAPLQKEERVPIEFFPMDIPKKIFPKSLFASVETASEPLNKLKEILEATGISLETLSKNTKMSKSMFIKKLNGDYEFYAEEMFILSQLCKKDLFSVLDEEGFLQSIGKRYLNFDMPVLTRIEAQKRLAENLKVIRRREGIEIEDAAKKLYIEAEHLIQIEDRKKKVRVSLLLDFAKLYKIAPEKFFIKPSEFYIN